MVFELGNQKLWALLYGHEYEKIVHLNFKMTTNLHVKDEESYNEQAHCKATHAGMKH